MKTVDFDENHGFWWKSTVFDETADFGLKTAVFGENHSFWADLSSETAKTTLPNQPSTGQHQTLKSMDFSVKQKTNWVHNTNIGITLSGKTTCLRR